MITKGYGKWMLALTTALVGHAALAFGWQQETPPQTERSAGAPVTIVGALSNFGDAQPLEEVKEDSELVEEETKPLEQQPVEDAAPLAAETPAETLAPAPITKAMEEPAESKPLTAEKPKKQEQKKKKKAAKRKKQKRVNAGKRQAAVRKGGGAKGRQKSRAGAATRANYAGRIQSHLARYKRSPGGGNRGRAVVRFTISRSGRVTSVRLARRSGNAAIDRAALSMVRRASPFPPIPAGMNGRMSFTVPVSYASR